MDANGWWSNTQVVAHGLLQLIAVLTKWPVMLFAIALLFVLNFKDQISKLIANMKISGRKGDMSITFEPSQSSMQVVSNSVNSPDREMVDNAANIDTSVTSEHSPSAKEEGGEPNDLVQKIQKLEQQKQAAEASAWHFYFMWLEGALVMRTKAVLQYVFGVRSISVNELRKVLWVIAKTDEASAIEDALVMNGLLQQLDGRFSVTSKGENFLKWRLANGMPVLGEIYAYSQFSPSPGIPVSQG